MTLGIFLPTYKRPDKLKVVATNVEQATKGDFNLYFGCEEEDTASIEAAKATGHEVVINKYDPKQGYSNTIQSIYESSNDTVVFHANDDFEFVDGWDVAPMGFLEQHLEVMVLGAHDGSDQPSYSTISFIRREYIEQYSGVVDIPNRVFYPYCHNYQDTEFTRTAQARGMWDKIETPCIKHHRVGGDETYRKNDATSAEDARTFQAREHLWKSINKEEIMARKPMTEERKKELSEQAKARWAEKKAGEQGAKSDNRPSIDSTAPDTMVGRALESIQSALRTFVLIRQEYPNMIEAAQVMDALTEARNRAGQVEGLLRSLK